MKISSVQASPSMTSVVSQQTAQKTIETHYESTIQSSEKQPPQQGGLFAAPVLMIMGLAEETSKIVGGLLESGVTLVKHVSEQNQKHVLEKIEALRKAANLAQASDVWSILQKIGTSIFAATNLFLGFSAYGNSPEVGGALIASGMLSATNLVMAELRGWEKIGDILAKENEEVKKNIAYWSPIVMSCLSFGITTYAGPSVLFNKNLFPQDFSFDPAICLKVYQGASTTGKSVTDAMYSWSQTAVNDLKNAIFLNVSLQDALSSWIKAFLDLLEHGRKLASNIVQLSSQIRM